MNTLWELAYALIKDGECLTAEQWAFNLTVDFPNEVLEEYATLEEAENRLTEEWEKGTYTEPTTGITKTWAQWSNHYNNV